MQRDMQDLVRRLLGDWEGVPLRSSGIRSWFPAIDVFAPDGDLVVRAELPGIDPEKDVEITLQEGVLTIRGERRREERNGGDSYFRAETSYGAFERRIPVPEGTKDEDIKATYVNGVLEVVVAGAAEHPQAKRIPIQMGSERKALTTRDRRK